MSNVEEVANKIEKMPLADHLKLAALALETKMDDKRTEIILMLLDIKLQQYRLCKRLNIETNGDL